ncbi:hypothetical protein Dacet_2657 [Denitrovibrio acetiphilus DSM 12809]|uniref:Uncharacterized protein n=1 Tax=Denitrovibrio acetiphilus (strain DSM 12809 / NBRC 114555 / N2460) TaxID=522772 RepID=D4H558_DENA2|nr:hypothetical protein [Denitrovibrio acetiphilus]ADD69414.1 hypothetical protein Dacet_2657 [Denitrovibrio acetiphilus DSM 12809]
MFKIPEVNVKNLLKVLMLFVLIYVVRLSFELSTNELLKQIMFVGALMVSFVLWSWIFMPLNAAYQRAKSLAIRFLHVLNAILLINLVQAEKLHTLIAGLIFVSAIVLDIVLSLRGKI